MQLAHRASASVLLFMGAQPCLNALPHVYMRLLMCCSVLCSVCYVADHARMLRMPHAADNPELRSAVFEFLKVRSWPFQLAGNSIGACAAAKAGQHNVQYQMQQMLATRRA